MTAGCCRSKDASIKGSDVSFAGDICFLSACVEDSTFTQAFLLYRKMRCIYERWQMKGNIISEMIKHKKAQRRKMPRELIIRWQVWILLVAIATIALCFAASYNWASTERFKSIQVRFGVETRAVETETAEPAEPETGD